MHRFCHPRWGRFCGSQIPNTPKPSRRRHRLPRLVNLQQTIGPFSSTRCAAKHRSLNELRVWTRYVRRSTPQMPLTARKAAHSSASTVSVGNGWQGSPCSLLLRFRDSVLAASLSPNSRATTSPSGVRQRFLQTRQCPAPLRSAYDLAIHQELCVARQCFWACSA